MKNTVEVKIEVEVHGEGTYVRSAAPEFNHIVRSNLSDFVLVHCPAKARLRHPLIPPVTNSREVYFLFFEERGFDEM
jgi:hypothetical protein